MSGSLLPVLLVLAAVLVVGLILGRGRKDEGAAPREGTAAPEPGDPDTELEDEDEDKFADDEVVAVTSDGYALLPDRHAVRLVPPDDEGEQWKSGDEARNKRGDAAIAMSWHHGDFTGARVVQGSGDEPWRLEALGREGEYTVFAFETREAADAALLLFESRRIIRLGTDEDGHSMPPSAEHFAEARRIYEQTESELAMAPEPGDEPGDPV